MGSTPTALTVRNAVQTALKTIDGSSTVTLGSSTWTYNYDLSSSTFIGGDPRAGTENAAAYLVLDSTEHVTGSEVGYITSTLALVILARAKPTANTSTARQDAALKLAGDIMAALMNDRSLSSNVIDILQEEGVVVETRDGDGDSGREWSAGNGFVRVVIQPSWCGRLGT